MPADLRLLGLRNLQVHESALTGESLPVAKQPDAQPPEGILADRKNLAFAGTFVSTGHKPRAWFASSAIRLRQAASPR